MLIIQLNLTPLYITQLNITPLPGVRFNRSKFLINNFKEMIICIKFFRMVKIDEQIRQLVVSKLMDGYNQVSVAAEVNIGGNIGRHAS